VGRGASSSPPNTTSQIAARRVGERPTAVHANQATRRCCPYAAAASLPGTMNGCVDGVS
jgi:hypothetical protein